MAKIKITCPTCDKALQCDEKYRGRKIKCPHCKHPVPVPQIKSIGQIPPPRPVPANRRRAKKKGKFLIISGILVLVAAMVVAGFLFVWPVRMVWPDRRPIGVLFLASGYHSSGTNPRGWFNDQTLDVIGPGGPERFRKALLDYADRSIDILKRTGAQGAIVWDLEGEEYPHKTTYIGDPRLLENLAPEMAPVADEFFARLRNAGFKVGVTVRPQELEYGSDGQPRQEEIIETKGILLDKIDYAQKRWGCTMFYMDSNGGVRRPDEVWQLRSLMKQRPDILLIPEHSYLPYAAFSAPYASLRKGNPAAATKWARKFFPGSFQALDVSDGSEEWAGIAAARSEGDILLFRAWFWSQECTLLENFANERK